MEQKISLCKRCCADCQFIGLDFRPFGRPVTDCRDFIAKDICGLNTEEQE